MGEDSLRDAVGKRRDRGAAARPVRTLPVFVPGDESKAGRREGGCGEDNLLPERVWRLDVKLGVQALLSLHRRPFFPSQRVS